MNAICLTSLPPKILSRICDYLNLSALLDLSLTCRAIQCIVINLFKRDYGDGTLPFIPGKNAHWNGIAVKDNHYRYCATEA